MLDDQEPAGEPLGMGRRADQQPVVVEQPVDLAGELDPAARENHQVVTGALQLGQDVRGEHDREPLAGGRL